MKYIITTASVISSLSAFAQTKIANTEALEKINKEHIQLVDVRTDEEYSKKHLKNSIHINWNDKENFDALASKLDKKKPVYVYCLSGGRSNKAAQYLTEKGFEVFDIEGGIMKWETANLPLVDVANKTAGLTLEDYASLTKSHPIVLIDFYADWCAPCKEMTPIIDKIAEDYKVKVVKIDTDKNNALVKELGVSRIPQLYIFKDGKKTWSKSGLTNIKTLKKKLK
jgi:thioredoxin 1